VLVVTCWKLSGVLHEVSGFTHDYPVSLDVTSCYVTCGLVMLRMLTCACLLHQASPQQDYGVAHRFLYLVCLAALLSLQVHPAHCNSIDLNNYLMAPAQVQQQDVAPVELLCSIAGALHASAEQRCAT